MLRPRRPLFLWSSGGGGGVPPKKNHTGRLRPKGYLFQASGTVSDLKNARAVYVILGVQAGAFNR